MEQKKKFLALAYAGLLSKIAKDKAEKVIIVGAIISFILHLLLIALAHLKIIKTGDYTELLTNPISAIYTPFSFILVFEVYLLVYYLPRSITIYIGKQYEIITLITIRRIFKDLGNMELTSGWFSSKADLQLTFDILTTLILFFLIYLFYRFNERKPQSNPEQKRISPETEGFINQKKSIAIVLVIILLALAVYSFGNWIYASFFSVGQMLGKFNDLNKIFFDQFFIILILTDVFLLLISLYNSDKFHRVIRNSGFIISTILIRFSFGVEGLLNTALVVVAVLVGVLILGIHNLYEKHLSSTE